MDSVPCDLLWTGPLPVFIQTFIKLKSCKFTIKNTPSCIWNWKNEEKPRVNHKIPVPWACLWKRTFGTFASKNFLKYHVHHCCFSCCCLVLGRLVHLEVPVVGDTAQGDVQLTVTEELLGTQEHTHVADWLTWRKMTALLPSTNCKLHFSTKTTYLGFCSMWLQSTVWPETASFPFQMEAFGPLDGRQSGGSWCHSLKLEHSVNLKLVTC